MELFADNPDVAFDPMIPGGGTLLTVSNYANFFFENEYYFFIELLCRAGSYYFEERSSCSPSRCLTKRCMTGSAAS